MNKYDFLNECKEIEDSYRELFGHRKLRDAWRHLEEEIEELELARPKAIQQRDYTLLTDELLDIMRMCYVVLRSSHHTHEQIIEASKKNGIKIRNRLEDLR